MSRNVLFIESPSLRYGSSISLLAMIDALDRSQYIPHVAVHMNNPLVHELTVAGIAVLPLDIADWGLGKSNSNNESVSGHRSVSRRSGVKRVAAPMLDYLRGARDRVQYAEVTLGLRRFIRQHAIDLVHANNQPSTNRFAYLAAGTRPIVQHVRDAPLTSSRMSQSLAQRASGMICISRFVADSARKTLNVEPEKLWVLPNGVPETYYQQPSRGALRAQLGLKPDDLVFAQIGRFVTYKGQDLFLHAFERAVAEMPSGIRVPKAVLIGSGEENPQFEAELRQKARTPKLQGHVHFAPYTRDILSLFFDVDVLVHFTRGEEAFGRVIVEAMAAGCSLLVSNRGALPELVEHGKNGFIANDVTDLSVYIRRMAGERDCVDRLKSTAGEMAEEYRAPSISRRLENIYDSVLDSHGR